MAVSSGFTHGPENSGIRDVNADIEAALKTRIGEYKDHGRDTQYMEQQLQRLQNAKKGRRRSSEEAVDDNSAGRDDSAECVVGAQDRQRTKREAGKSQAHKKRDGVPDQLTDKTPDPEAQAGEAADVPDQKSPWPAKKVEPAIRQPDQPVPGQGQGSLDPEPNKDEAKSALPTQKKPGEAKR